MEILERGGLTQGFFPNKSSSEHPVVLVESPLNISGFRLWLKYSPLFCFPTSDLPVPDTSSIEKRPEEADLA